MRRAVCTAVAACLTTIGTPARQGTVFRAGTDLTHMVVTVTDRRGTPVGTLEAGDFEVLEDGRPQTIAAFARAGDHAFPALHAGLMLDTSVSMTEDRKTAQDAAVEFLDRLPDYRDLTLVEFDATVRMSRFMPDDSLRLIERIRARRDDVYSTALYDAFAAYLDAAAKKEGQSVLVAVTDGADSRSVTNYGDVIEIVRALPQVRVYAIGLVQHQRSDQRLEAQVRLSRIAEESGGQAFFPLSMRQVSAAYDRILAELRAQYSLGYVSTNTNRDGAWREVQVRIRNPRLKDLRVRTRKGYFAPLP